MNGVIQRAVLTRKSNIYIRKKIALMLLAAITSGGTNEW